MTAIAVLAAACYVFGYYRTPAVYAGFLLQAAYLSARGVHLDRLPLVGPHDTLFFLSASLMLFAIPISRRMLRRNSFLNAAIALAAAFIFLSLLYRPHEYPLPPVLRTFWFESHVALSFFSYALFALGAVAGGMIIRLDRKSRARTMGGDSSPVPGDSDERGENGTAETETEMRQLAAVQYKSILVGYFLFSAGMIFGGVWAFYAWGTYWLWTPKELWTVILWLFYSLYLHARYRKWWAGTPTAVLGILGFGIVLFTYLGVSLFMKSSHSF